MESSPVWHVANNSSTKGCARRLKPVWFFGRKYTSDVERLNFGSLGISGLASEPSETTVACKHLSNIFDRKPKNRCEPVGGTDWVFNKLWVNEEGCARQRRRHRVAVAVEDLASSSSKLDRAEPLQTTNLDELFGVFDLQIGQPVGQPAGSQHRCAGALGGSALARWIVPLVLSVSGRGDVEVLPVWPEPGVIRAGAVWLERSLVRSQLMSGHVQNVLIKFVWRRGQVDDRRGFDHAEVSRFVDDAGGRFELGQLASEGPSRDTTSRRPSITPKSRSTSTADSSEGISSRWSFDSDILNPLETAQ